MILTRLSSITDVALMALCQHFNRLEELDVSHCPHVSDQGVLHIAGHCLHLQQLSLKGCHRVSDEGVSELAYGCLYLKRLNVLDCRKVTDVAIDAITSMLPDLEELSVSGVDDQVTDQSLAFLAKRCHLLRRLQLRDSPGITDTALCTVMAKCPYLEHLDVSGCCMLTDVSVLVAAFRLTRLRVICAVNCWRVSGQMMHAARRRVRIITAPSDLAEFEVQHRACAPGALLLDAMADTALTSADDEDLRMPHSSTAHGSHCSAALRRGQAPSEAQDGTGAQRSLDGLQ